MARLAPTRSVNMLHAFVTYMLKRLLYRHGQRFAEPLLGLAERPEREVNTQDLREQNHRLPPAQAIGAGQQPDERDEPDATHPLRHAGRELRPRHVATPIARAVVETVLGHFRHDDWELGHLVAKRLSTGYGRQVVPACAARLREVIQGRRHLFGWHELPPMALVARLAPSLLAAPLLLRALGPLLWRVGRMRLARI